MTLAIGRHTAIPTTWGLIEVGKDDTILFAVEFMITEGENKGERITWRSGFSSEKAVEYTVSQLRALGWLGTKFDSVQLSEEPVQIQVRLGKEYNGTRTPEVAYVVTEDSFERFAMEGSKASAFAAKMEERVRALQSRGNGGVGF